ncbi:lysozyme [Afifella sp. IM 167]|uniref:lysozyme n=1 Tax=Afifella sp. IM 167 TaxID=2033586 RepID=UPI001CCFE35F|nr:lysozyme [Afifella sp. IM 167]MBZ8133209.1 lysozyme [Afifella sp. IM 167]
MASRLTKGVLGTLTAAGILAVGFVGGWEGKHNTAYRDIVGVPTICFGETRGVEMGDTATDEECAAMLGDGLVEFEAGIRRCLKNPDQIPDKSYVAFLSAAYNIGQRAFCGSSMARRWNAGNLEGACDALLLWNKAGGRVIRGLVNRRKAERELCLEGSRAQ